MSLDKIQPHRVHDNCKDCDYYSRDTRTCDYILRVKKRRPCPPGPGCTVKSTEGNIPIWRDTLARDKEIVMCSNKRAEDERGWW